jgi:hypothetical protein
MHRARQMFRGFQLSFDECLVDDHLGVTSINSLLSQASTCFRIGSKFRRIRSTPTAMHSIGENDFECFANTGVTAPETIFPVRGSA